MGMPFLLHIEGMDLAGKSTIAKLFSETSNMKWNINDKVLTSDNAIYAFAWQCGKSSEYRSDVLGHLYLAALIEDIRNFRLETNIIQDSTLLLRSLNYYKTIEINNTLFQSFSEIALMHPIPNISFYLTADINSRRLRLEQRKKHNPSKITEADLMIESNTSEFIKADNSLKQLSIEYFNSYIIDTSQMNEIEVVEFMLNRCLHLGIS